MATKKKKKKGIDITMGGGVFDDEFVTIPSGKFNIKKGDKRVDLNLSKPFSKYDKENINSTVGFDFVKEGKNSRTTIGGSKTGKEKNINFSFTKSFSDGGEARGTGAAITGKKFTGIF